MKAVEPPQYFHFFSCQASIYPLAGCLGVFGVDACDAGKRPAYIVLFIIVVEYGQLRAEHIQVAPELLGRVGKGNVFFFFTVGMCGAGSFYSLEIVGVTLLINTANVGNDRNVYIVSLADIVEFFYSRLLDTLQQFATDY